MFGMVSTQVAIAAVAVNPALSFEDEFLAASHAVISNIAISLTSLVLLVVRLIISGRVAVGGFARN